MLGLVLEGAHIDEIDHCPDDAEQESTLNGLDAEFEVPAFAVVGGRVLLVLDIDRFQVRRGVLRAAKEQYLAPRVNNDGRFDHVPSQLRQRRLTRRRLSGRRVGR